MNWSDHVYYDETSPSGLRWKRYAANNKIKPGDVAGRPSEKLYWSTYVLDRRYFNHRIVYELFNGSISIDLVVDHIDGNKSNNTLANIELSNPKHNAAHASKLGLLCKGSSHINSKLTEEQVMVIKNKCGTVTQQELAKIYNVSHQLISDIKLGKAWKHV